jgi:endonuclease/exonuclease/phosphatase family metal-dependent hydrolase
MTRCSLLLASVVLATACASVDHRPHVVIDGGFDDWEQTPAVTVDGPDAQNGFIDLGTVKVRHDRDAVYFMVHVGRIVTAQRLEGTVSLLLDVDGDPLTGHTERGMDGVDVALEFPLPNERAPGTPGAGIRLRAITNGGGASEPINAYSVGFVLAPVHAGNIFEMRIDRRGPIGPTPPLFQSEAFRGKFVAVDLESRPVDETEIFRYPLTRTAKPVPRNDESIDPLRRLTGTDFRIVFWNVARGAYIRNPEPFSRVLSAVRPDIIVLDEVPPTTNAEEIRQFLRQSFILDSWNVYFGEGGNDQRTIIASRADVRPAEPFRKVGWTDHDIATLVAMSNAEDAEAQVRRWLGDSVPTGGALVTIGDRMLLVAGVDLQCCGGYETIQDRRRIVEAEAVNRAIRDTLASTPVDGVVLGGDFNLVGDPAVLSIAGGNAAPDGTSLTRARALQIDGLTDATWASPDEPFVPGRLDNVLYSDGTLAVKRAFVFDSGDLTQRWQAYHGVRAGDSPAASDHFPVVVDFQWIGGSSTRR